MDSGRFSRIAYFADENEEVLEDTQSQTSIKGKGVWVYDDGGQARERSGYVYYQAFCRAIAIATGDSYAEVAEVLSDRTRAYGSHGFPVLMRVADDHLRRLGWRWTPTVAQNGRSIMRLRTLLGSSGRFVAQLHSHVTTVIDGVIHDTTDPSDGGRRCVRGFWSRG